MKTKLSLEEWQRLATVTPKERDKAFRKLQRWISHEITHRGFKRDFGPFSYGSMGGDPVEIISNECLEALFCGEWHWKPDRELSSMLINIAKSKMGHIIEDFYKQELTDIMLTSDETFREGIEKSLAAQWKFEANMRDWGYEIARNAVKDDAELIAYLEAMFKDDTYVGIASLMGIDVKDVYKLEARLLKRLKDTAS